MVKVNKKIEDDLKDILRICRNSSLVDFDANKDVNLFSRRIGFNAIEMVYVFMLIEDTFHISITEIDWKNQDLFTFKGLCKIISKHMKGISGTY